MKMGDKAIVEVNYFFRVFRNRSALGVGGYPRGRIIEIYGPESSGKTTALYTLLPKLKSRRNCSFIDAEHAFDRNYAEKLVDIENLIISQPDNGEKLEIAENQFVREQLILL
jgi:recombination protein RecA